MAWRNLSGQSRSKLKNKRTNLDGYSFQSGLEASTYAVLKLLQKAGEIKSIQVQDHCYLTDARILYIADFKCELPDGSFYWVESKGFEQPTYKLKKKLWEYYGPGDLLIYKGTAIRPILIETVKVKEKKT